ncbi:hypothetical protein ACTXT7_011399 [Hymenolepis weldensis]
MSLPFPSQPDTNRLLIIATAYPLYPYIPHAIFPLAELQFSFVFTANVFCSFPTTAGQLPHPLVFERGCIGSVNYTAFGWSFGHYRLYD